MCAVCSAIVICILETVFFLAMTALNDALKEEIQHLKMLTGQAIPNGGPMMNYPAFRGNQPHYPSNNQSTHTLMAAQEFQQLQIHSQKQQQQNHQFQQHQLLQHQQQFDPHQRTEDLKTRTHIRSPSQNDNALKLSQSMKE